MQHRGGCGAQREMLFLCTGALLATVHDPSAPASPKAARPKRHKEPSHKRPALVSPTAQGAGIASGCGSDPQEAKSLAEQRIASRGKPRPGGSSTRLAPPRPTSMPSRREGSRPAPKKADLVKPPIKSPGKHQSYTKSSSRPKIPANHAAASSVNHSQDVLTDDHAADQPGDRVQLSSKKYSCKNKFERNT